MLSSDAILRLYTCIYTDYFLYSYDELLIGAPLYSYVAGALNCLDCGRVYVYRNNDTVSGYMYIQCLM